MGEDIIQLSEEEINKYRQINIPDVKSQKDIDLMRKSQSFYSGLRICKELNGELENYHKLVREIAEFLDSFNLQDDLDLCNAFSYLLWNGFFSKNQKFEFRENYINTLKRVLNLGSSVMNGHGVCISIVSLLDDILSEMKRSGALLTGELICNTSSENSHDIESCENINNSSNSNHVCELINVKNTQVIYDPTNLAIYPINGYHSVTSYNKPSLSFTVKPRLSCLLKGYSFSDLEKLKELATDFDIVEGKIVVLDSFRRIFKSCERHYEYFQLFHKNIEPQVLEIAKKACSPSVLEMRKTFRSVR